MTVRGLLIAALVAGLAVGGCATSVDGSDDGPGASSEAAGQRVPAPLVVVVDSSGSMAIADAPGPRIDAARNALQTLLGEIGGDAEIGEDGEIGAEGAGSRANRSDDPAHSTEAAEFGLVVYGANSRGEDGPASCSDITAPIPLGPVDVAAVTAATDTLTPGGWTPIGAALSRAAELLPADDSAQQIVVLSDGESTCEPPPCEVARQLRQQRPGLTISTIGFRSDAEELSCIADAAGGMFVTAQNAQQLTARLAALSRLDSATSTLSGRSAHGIELGASLQAIREAFPDFPATGTDSDAGSTETSAGGTDSAFDAVMSWRDMRWAFRDGLLVSVIPLRAGTTIDGVGVGTTVARLIELYGQPLAWETGPGGTSVGSFTADDDLGTVWLFTTTGTAPDDTVDRIELTRRNPGDVGPALMELVTPAGGARPYGGDWQLSPTPARYRPEQRFARSHGLVTTAHGDANSGLRACWRETDSSALCTSSVHDRLLFRVDARYTPAPGLDGPLGDLRAVNSALAVVLDDDEVCDTVGYAGTNHFTSGSRHLVSQFLCRDGRRLWTEMDAALLPGPATLPMSRSSGGGHGSPDSEATVAGYVFPLDNDAEPR